MDRVEDVDEEDLTFLIHADLEVPGDQDQNLLNQNAQLVKENQKQNQKDVDRDLI